MVPRQIVASKCGPSDGLEVWAVCFGCMVFSWVFKAFRAGAWLLEKERLWDGHPRPTAIQTEKNVKGRSKKLLNWPGLLSMSTGLMLELLDVTFGLECACEEGMIHLAC